MNSQITNGGEHDTRSSNLSGQGLQLHIIVMQSATPLAFEILHSPNFFTRSRQIPLIRELCTPKSCRHYLTYAAALVAVYAYRSRPLGSGIGRLRSLAVSIHS